MTSRGWQNNWNASRGGRHQYRGNNRPHHYGNFNSSQRDPREVEWQQNNTANPSARRPYQGDPQQVQYQASHYCPDQKYYSNRQTNNNFSRGGEWQLNNAANPSARRPYQGDPQQAEYQASYARSGGDATALASATTSSSGQGNQLPLQQRVENPSIMEVISSKDFDDLTFEEKVREQLSKVIDYEYFRLESLPVEITVLLPKDFDCEEAREAATKAINEVMARQESKRNDVMGEKFDENEDESMNDSDDSDDYDDYDRRTFKKKKANDPGLDFTLEEIESFFNSLLKNYVFRAGFFVIKGLNAKDEENCWCPCGNQMLPWRLRFGLDDLVTKYKFTSCGKGKSRFTPMGLMAHLEAKKESCVLHYGVDVFLRELYRNLRGTGHKALFKPVDPNYKIAEAAEKQEVTQWQQQNNTANPSARRPYQGDPQQVQYQASHYHPDQNYYSNRQTNNNFSRGGEWQLNNAANPSARRPYQGDPKQAEYQASYARSGGDAPPQVSATTSSSGQANQLPVQQRIENPSIMEVISSKDFDDLTFEEKLREQLSKVIDYEYFRLESLPVEITHAINEVMAMKEIIKEMSEEHEDEDESMNDSDDSDDYDDYERRTFKKKVDRVVDDYGWIPLHYAIYGNVSLNLLNLMIESYPEGVDYKSRNGRAPLDILKQKKFAEKKDSKGMLLLHHACNNGYSLHLIHFLIQAYPESTTVQDNNGNTPWQYLTKAASHVDEKGMLLLHREAAHHSGLNIEMLPHLLYVNPEAIQLQDNLGLLPIHHASLNKGSSLDALILLVKLYPESIAV